jgi:hypothetical protein
MTASSGLSAALDVRAFASQVLGFELFDHQAEFLTSPERYVLIVAGRQSGKSRAIATRCLFEAATHAGYRVLIVSQGEAASIELLAECADLAAGSPSLRGSVLDDSRSELILSNGSQIKAVPASYRQIRGRSIDLLCIDEAAFISEEIWQAAEPTIAARPGARVILASTPWGDVTHWFRALYQRGLDAPDAWVRSFHWTSAASPLVSPELLEFWRTNWPEYRYRTEVLAEWADAAGSYFSERELMAAVCDYELLTVDDVTSIGPRTLPAVGGVDWGVRDANAVVLISPVDDYGMNARRLDGDRPLFIPFLEARHGWAWDQFIEHLVGVCSAFDVMMLASETNGVGAWPTEDLAARVRARVEGGHYRTVYVSKVWTDVRRKMSGFAKIRGLMGTGRLVLPRHPELLKQLRALQFEQQASGTLRISVPENRGSDDLALALMQAVSSVNTHGLQAATYDYYGRLLPGRALATEDIVETPAGIRLPRAARPDTTVTGFAMWPEGREQGEVW